jgi:2-oxoglutarate ferredoxin oxidoreductase subunit gamma
MNEQRIIVSGFGGQGVLMIGKLLASAGMAENKRVTWLPSYGPEMRGGTANCHVIVSDELIGAPVITEATCVIAMNLPSLDIFEFTRSMIPRDGLRHDITTLSIPANDLACEEGSLKVANVVMLGAYLAWAHALGTDSVITVLRELLGDTKQQLLDINLRALDRGLHFAG